VFVVYRTDRYEDGEDLATIIPYIFILKYDGVYAIIESPESKKWLGDK